MIDLSGFADPWEHIRLLSDVHRNEQLQRLLARRCPGQRVCEVGCGTGLLSLVAAKLGARKVYAVEPTEQVEAARLLVEHNRLGHVIEVIEGRIQDVPVREVDFLFSELLNADPFAEGVMETMAWAQRWLAPSGFSSPSRLRVMAALVREGDSAREVRQVRQQLRRMSERYDLRLEPLDELFTTPGAYAYFGTCTQLAGEPVVVWDLAVGHDDVPSEPVEVALPVDDGEEPVDGLVVWFEADLDEGLVLDNKPPRGGHWGQLLIGFPTDCEPDEGVVRVWIDPDEDGMTAHLD
jgi:protein arginine N-methyltransferase 1